MYGIELDLKNPKGTDGRRNNRRFFKCRDGHAVFVRKKMITQIVDQDEIVLPQTGNRVKMTKGRFGVIQAIEELQDGVLEYNINVEQLIDRKFTQKPDISHKRQHSSGGVRRFSINNNMVKSGRQSGLLDMEDSAYKKLMVGAVDDDSDNYDSDDDNYTALGETIELRSGKIVCNFPCAFAVYGGTECMKCMLLEIYRVSVWTYVLHKDIEAQRLCICVKSLFKF